MITNNITITHLQNHNYNIILRTYCGKSNYDIYIDREEWTNDVLKVNCEKCLKIIDL